MKARAGIDRLPPGEAWEAVQEGALLIDIRSDTQRAQDGELPTATFIPRNVLEWRLDPESPHRDTEVAQRDRMVILICSEGYQSSLAAATICRLGIDAEPTSLVGSRLGAPPGYRFGLTANGPTPSGPANRG